jgi:hypothetical protein
MADQPDIGGPLSHRARGVVLVALLLAACVGGRVAERGGNGERRAWRERQGSQHEWWTERGLVIPHASFPADCTLCHLEGDWSTLRPDFQFDHAQVTGVALEGAHAAAQCLRCHNDRGPVQAFAQRGCVGCHDDVHQGVRSTGCDQCHGQEDWQVDEDRLVHARTRFALIGPHASAACRDCHVGINAGVLEPLDTSCESCHTDDLARALDPDHAALGWTMDCEECHQVSTFGAAGFLHPGFPLSGGHAALDCSACHSGGVFTGTPSACVACHQDDYNGTTDPNHMALGFPTTCQDCHSTSSWGGATFDHETWPLTGAHASTSCSECHGGGVYAGTPTACFACHQTEYNNTTDPNHVTAGFPTTCQACHSTSTWSGATFNHTWFPIVGGDHGGFTCTECHQVPGNFTIFSCIHCHDHRQTEMDDEHEDVPGYVWQSSACYQCHPNGQEHALNSVRRPVTTRRAPAAKPAPRPSPLRPLFR